MLKILVHGACGRWAEAKREEVTWEKLGVVESVEVKGQQTRISTEWLITQEEVELGELLHLVSSRDIVDEGIIWKVEGNIYGLGDELANLRRNVLGHRLLFCLVLFWKEGKILGVVAFKYPSIQLKVSEKVVYTQN